MEIVCLFALCPHQPCPSTYWGEEEVVVGCPVLDSKEKLALVPKWREVCKSVGRVGNPGTGEAGERH